MTTMLVTGATGTLGRPTVARLRGDAHDVRALSRRTGPGLVTADLLTGEGLDAALDGVEVVLHLATGKGDVRAAGTLVDAAKRSGVRHLVFVSIVGIEAFPMAYYRQRMDIESIVADSGIPFTIQRSAQFHTLILGLLRAQRFSPLLFVPALPLQPIDPREVAVRMAELAVSAPAGRVPDIAGPAVDRATEFAREWKRIRGVRRPIVPIATPKAIFKGYATGAATVPGAPYGTVTFAEYAEHTAYADSRAD
jgi:uncharacterized protein YbjT (DUF2867 family)